MTTLQSGMSAPQPGYGIVSLQSGVVPSISYDSRSSGAPQPGIVPAAAYPAGGTAQPQPVVLPAALYENRPRPTALDFPSTPKTMGAPPVLRRDLTRTSTSGSSPQTSGSSASGRAQPVHAASFSKVGYYAPGATPSARLARSGTQGETFGAFGQMHYTPSVQSPSAKYVSSSEPLPQGSVPQAAFTRMRAVPAVNTPSAKLLSSHGQQQNAGTSCGFRFFKQ